MCTPPALNPREFRENISSRFNCKKITTGGEKNHNFPLYNSLGVVIKRTVIERDFGELCLVIQNGNGKVIWSKNPQVTKSRK